MRPARLAAGFWVAAYLRRLDLAGIHAYLAHRGDDTAGAVVVKLSTLDGQARAFQRLSETRAWQVLVEGAERDVDAALSRARARDPDLWVIEVEDRAGRALLDGPGLGDEGP